MAIWKISKNVTNLIIASSFVLFEIAGTIMFFTGIYYTIFYVKYKHCTDAGWEYAVGDTLLGLLIAALPFGLFTSRQKQVICFCGIFFLIILLQLVIASLLLTNKYKAIKKNVETSLEECFENPDKIDYIQEQFKCCGLTGPTWWTAMRNQTIPDSCYNAKHGLYQTACVHAVTDFANTENMIYGITDFVAAACEIPAVTLVLLLVLLTDVIPE